MCVIDAALEAKGLLTDPAEVMATFADKEACVACARILHQACSLGCCQSLVRLSNLLSASLLSGLAPSSTSVTYGNACADRQAIITCCFDVLKLVGSSACAMAHSFLSVAFPLATMVMASTFTPCEQTRQDGISVLFYRAAHTKFRAPPITAAPNGCMTTLFQTVVARL